MAEYYGDFLEDATVRIPFNTFSSNDPQASVTITNLADADIKVHKDGGTTQIATDGATIAIDFDTITGNHIATIDTSAHADYAIGADYMVRIEGTTVDAGTINAWIGTFSIENRSSSLSATALAALEDQYDGTGLTGDTYPATQSQVSSIVSTGAAINVLPIAAPNGFTLTTGSEVGDEDRTHALDGIRHELSDAAGTLDAVYKFDIGGDAAPVGLTFTGLFNSANDSWAISANIGTDSTPVWQQVGTLSGSGGAGNTVHPFDMFANQIVTDLAGIVHIRVNGTGLTTSSFDPDQVFVSKSDTSRSVGYDGGQVWINTVGGTAGTESHVNGTADKAVLTLADAITIASNVGLNRFDVSNESTITFAESHANEVWKGEGWTLLLGGQNISQAHMYHCNDISGIGTTATGECHILHSHVGAITLGISHITECSFHSTFDAGAAGNYDVENCRSGVAGANNPTMTYTGLGSASTVNVRGWQGGAEWVFDSNIIATVEVLLGGTHTITTGGGDVEFRGSPKAVVLITSGTGTTNIVVNSGAPISVSGTGGTVNIYGWHGGITDTSTGPPANDYGANVTDLPAVLLDTADLQANQGDWLTATGFSTHAAADIVSGGAINTTGGAVDTVTANTDMRGTESAATEAKQDIIDANVDNLVLGIILGAAATGTLSTTQATSDLTGYTNDQLIGRIITVTSGNAEGESSAITDYVEANGLLTFDAMTLAMGNGDSFKIT